MLIGELAAQSGVSARMLRHYDSIGLVAPSERTAGGYRRYSENDVRRLFHVEALRSLGLTLQEVAEALDAPDFAPSVVIARLVARTGERIEQERQLLRRLERVRDSEPDAWSGVLRIIGLMHGLDSDDPSVRQRAALATSPGDADAAVLVEAAVVETDPNAAGALDWALARIGDDAVPLLKTSLESPDVAHRRRAAVTLEKIGSARALAALAGALTDTDAVVRSRAALIRGRRGDLDAVPALIDLIVQGNEDVEAADVLAAMAAASLQASEIVAMISERVPAADAAERARLTGALAGITGPEADAALAALSVDPDERVALTARYLMRTRT